MNSRIKSMNNYFKNSIAAVSGMLMAFGVNADALTAQQIMQKVYDRDDGNHAVMEMEMTSSII